MNNRADDHWGVAALIAAAVLVVGASVPMLVLAQYRVNNQIYGSSGSVRFASKIQIPSASYQTPSEVRMAIHKSGATPSQLKTEYNRIGPLSPTGAIAYVPPAVNFYSKPAGQINTGNYVNTQGIQNIPAPSRAAAAPAAAPANPFATNQFSGSVRYAPSSWSPGYQPSVTSWSSIGNNANITGSPISSSPIQPASSFSSPLMYSPSGSVR